MIWDLVYRTHIVLKCQWRYLPDTDTTNQSTFSLLSVQPSTFHLSSIHLASIQPSTVIPLLSSQDPVNFHLLSIIINHISNHNLSITNPSSIQFLFFHCYLPKNINYHLAYICLSFIHDLLSILHPSIIVHFFVVFYHPSSIIHHSFTIC